MRYFYDFIKLFHFISAAILVMSFCYSSGLWLRLNKEALDRILAQTGAVIIPCALFQLMTGFTLVSLKYSELPLYWIEACIIGFIVAMAMWFLFIYGLFLNRIQPIWLSITLIVCAISLLFLVFLMSNAPL
ncbi:MAG: hypothetical protein K0R24_407 [Gammaproteobacteria bacterium]|nr:hypothetical protein [Gammaproteobacteria bacterium]